MSSNNNCVILTANPTENGAVSKSTCSTVKSSEKPKQVFFVSLKDNQSVFKTRAVLGRVQSVVNSSGTKKLVPVPLLNDENTHFNNSNSSSQNSINTQQLSINRKRDSKSPIEEVAASPLIIKNKTKRKEVSGNSVYNDISEKAYQIFCRSMEQDVQFWMPHQPVTKTLTKMWDELSNEDKDKYKQIAELQSKKLSTPTSESQTNLSNSSQTSSIFQKITNSKISSSLSINVPTIHLSDSDSEFQDNDLFIPDDESLDSPDSKTCNNNFDSKSIFDRITESDLNEHNKSLESNSIASEAEEPLPLCSRDECTNSSVPSKSWSGTFCSSSCCVKLCKNVFNEWVNNRNQATS